MPPEEETTTEEAQTPLSLLAQQNFGTKFHGEVAEDPPPITDDAEEAPEESVDESEESEQSTDDEETSSEEEGDPIQSLSELAEWMQENQGVEVDSEFLEGLKVNTRVRGEDREYSIKELKEAAMKADAADSYLEQAKEQGKQQQAEIQQQAQEWTNRVTEAAAIIQEAEKLLKAEEESIDWRDLRENNPAEFSAMKAEFDERRQRIEQVKAEARNTVVKGQEEQSQQYQGWVANHVMEEQQKLLDKLPDWKNAETLQKEQPEITQYLQKEYGLTTEEIQAISSGSAADHRLILIARKAWLYDKQAGNKETAKKKLKVIPQKSMKPGTTKNAATVNQEQVDRARDKLRKSGRLEDAFAVHQARKGRT